MVKCEHNSRVYFSHRFDLISESSILDFSSRFLIFSFRELSFFEKQLYHSALSGAMYPSSKNKASFRIADILHQQQQQQQQSDSQLLAHHLMLKNSVHSSEMNKGSNPKSHPNSNDLSVASKSPSPEASPIPEISPEHAHSKGDVPMKPTPMYTNFPMPFGNFPLGIHPAFHPAAAYLNYADAIHKGESRVKSRLQNSVQVSWRILQIIIEFSGNESSTHVFIESCDQLITASNSRQTQ